ncbi:hypothetical protein KEM54_000694, partial [Ascosphaera aggregata]
MRLSFSSLTSVVALTTAASPVAPAGGGHDDHLHLHTHKNIEIRYAILDNDWSGSASFTPILMTLKGGMEVLGVVSGKQSNFLG